MVIELDEQTRWKILYYAKVFGIITVIAVAIFGATYLALAD